MSRLKFIPNPKANLMPLIRNIDQRLDIAELAGPTWDRTLDCFFVSRHRDMRWVLGL